LDFLDHRRFKMQRMGETRVRFAHLITEDQVVEGRKGMVGQHVDFFLLLVGNKLSTV
jgi:hypothetical protein